VNNLTKTVCWQPDWVGMFMPEPIGSSIGMSGCIREQSNFVGSVARTCRAICLRSDILRQRGRICCHHLFVGNYLRSSLLFEPNLCRERTRKRSQNPFLDALKTFNKRSVHRCQPGNDWIVILVDRCHCSLERCRRYSRSSSGICFIRVAHCPCDDHNPLALLSLRHYV
jgi:hypothetical protein